MLEGVDQKTAREILEQAYETQVDVSKSHAKFLKAGTKVEVPDGTLPLNISYESLGDRAQDYMSARGFNVDLLAEDGWGYCVGEGEMFGRIFIPMTYKGKLRTYVGRSFIGANMRYYIPPTELFGVGRNDYFFNQDALDMYPEVFITEGAIDAKTIGDEGIASSGWSLSDRQFEALVDSKAVKVIIPDGDLVNKGAEMALKLYSHTPVKLVNISPLCDFANDIKDVNKIGAIPVLKLAYEAKVNDLDLILSLL